jgi:hypothetical protein
MGLGQTFKAYIPNSDQAGQSAFSFMLSSATDLQRLAVVRLAPLRQRAYLDYGVYDVFKDIPGAAKPALKLEAKGIWILGLLVQLSENDVRRLVSVSDETLERMKRRLARIDFGFDMRIPWWNREYKTFCEGRYWQGSNLS